jgi:hypothetical protein
MVWSLIALHYVKRSPAPKLIGQRSDQRKQDRQATGGGDERERERGASGLGQRTRRGAPERLADQ